MNLENRAIYNDECSNHHKSDKQDMNEIFSFNMNEIELRSKIKVKNECEDEHAEKQKIYIEI